MRRSPTPSRPSVPSRPRRSFPVLEAAAASLLAVATLVAAGPLPAQPRLRPAPLPTPTPTPPPPEPVDQIAAFDDMMADVHASLPEHHSARVARWDRDFAPTSPLERPDGSTIFFFLGEADSVGLLGGMVQWNEPLSMRRVGTSSLWVREARFEPDARFDYVYSVDGALIPDPRNTRPGWTPYGRGSEWHGRRYVPPAFRTAAIPAAARGEVRRFRLGDRTLHVYLPAGYDANASRRYPVIYCPVDGPRYLDRAEVPLQLDARVARLGPAAGAIAVMVEHATSPSDLAADPETARWIADTLVPFVDSALRSRPERAARILVGAGWGAAVCLDAAIEAPRLYGAVLLQSPRLFPDGRDLADILRRRTPMGMRLLVEIGTYETADDDGRDPLADARRLRSVLAARPIDYRFREFPQGTSWGLWRDRLDVLLTEALGE